MKTKVKSYLSGFLTAILLIGAGTLVYAQTVNRNITYGVRINLNGQLMQLDADSQPFVMDGRTFLPVRAIADAVGLAVDFDAGTNTVYLGNRHAGQRLPLSTAVPSFQQSPFPASGGIASIASVWVAPTNNTSHITMAGQRHDNAIIYGTQNWTEQVPFTQHNLNSQYRLLTGYIGHVDGSSNLSNAIFRFYGDGTLLFTHQQSPSSLPTPISIFVEGVNLLRVEVEIPGGTPGVWTSRRDFALVGFLE